MIAVIFEVQPKNEAARAHYLDTAAALRAELASVPGCLSVERFESLTTPGKLLSLQYWTNEEALSEWRKNEAHRQAQQLGRTELFKDYRICVANIVRDYAMIERSETPADSRERHG